MSVLYIDISLQQKSELNEEFPICQFNIYIYLKLINFISKLRKPMLVKKTDQESRFIKVLHLIIPFLTFLKIRRSSFFTSNTGAIHLYQSVN